MNKVFFSILLALAAVSAVAANPVQDEGYYTDEYLARSGQYTTAKDAWDEGYRQGLAKNAGQQKPAIHSQSQSQQMASIPPRGQTSAEAHQQACNQSPDCTGNLTYSYGTDVPLRDALTRIVPQGWTVIVPPDYAATKVTWNAGMGSPWPAVARVVAKQAGLALAINPGYQSVSVAATQDDANRLCSGEQTWQIVPGKSLRENLQAWADKAGWGKDFAWEAVSPTGSVVDYQITHGATFIGTFNGPHSVIAQVLALYAKAQYPLQHEFTPNHVLLISVVKHDAASGAPGVQ